MASKTSAEVIIDGKVYTLAGYASEEYLQKIASYLNGKIAEFGKNEGYIKLNTDYRNTLMQINMQKEKDLYDVKHELVTSQMKLDSTEKKLRQAEKDLDESAKKIIRLETEMKTREEDKRSRG